MLQIGQCSHGGNGWANIQEKIKSKMNILERKEK